MIKMTLRGALIATKDTLFDFLELPEGIDKDVLIDRIMLLCSERPLIVPDPFSLRIQIGMWARAKAEVFRRIVKLYEIEYNPLENYHSHENRQDSASSSITLGTKSENSGTDTVSSLHKVSAYDSSTLSDNSEDITTSQPRTSVTNSGTNTTNSQDSYTLERYGNIGVMTTQAMFNEELKLLQNTNMYDLISVMFSEEFTLYFFD